MATATLNLQSAFAADLIWARDLTLSETEFLLDSLEAHGFDEIKMLCTPNGLFAVQIPSRFRNLHVYSEPVED
jgi:hypothetical protein